MVNPTPMPRRRGKRRFVVVPAKSTRDLSSRSPGRRSRERLVRGVARAEAVFHPDASVEYGQAYAWYARHDPRAAERFEQEVEFAVQRIAEDPQRWPAYGAKH